jgi:hypothetical protein
VSTGFVYFRSTDAARTLVWEILHTLARAEPWEQRLFNELLPAHVECGLRMEMLDARRFNNMLGFTVLTNGTHTAPANAVLVHAGHLSGPGEKINAFKRFGLWRPSGVFPLPP